MRKGLGQQGFSLFEMLLVMALLGVMVTMAGLAVGPLLDKVEFRRQTEKYTSLLRYVRLLAITSGKPTSLALGGVGEDCVFKIAGSTEEEKACGLGDNDVLVMDPGVLTFFPEGTATPGVLTFRREGRKAVIRLDLLTGRPEMERGD